MKFIRATSTVAALLLFGTTISVYAQREGGEKQEEKQSAPHGQAPQQHAAQAPAQTHAAQPRPQEQPRAAQPKPPEPRAQPAAQQHMQQTRQAAGQQAQPQRTQQQARTWQQQKSWTQGGGSPGHATFAQDRSQNWSSDHRTWAQRGGYGGYVIPQDRFSLSFGSEHIFRIGALPGMYLGYPQFSYGGFSFLMVDPWPGDWAANWYTSDDVYIGYHDGYYLYNRRYPQVALAITIEL